jgi:hypothetical protein
MGIPAGGGKTSRVTGPQSLPIVRTRPGNSATGPVERGHQAPSSSVRREPVASIRSRGVDGGVNEVMALRSAAVVALMVVAAANAAVSRSRMESRHRLTDRPFPRPSVGRTPSRP